MSDVKNALSALCKYVNSLIGVGLTAEHLELAGHDAPDEAASENLWRTLHILSYHAAREKRSYIDFRNYDVSTAVKLHLAFLRYPVTRFYGLSRGSNRNRDSLIALAWLLGAQDVLAAVFRARLTNSALGVECSHAASLRANPSLRASTVVSDELDERPSSANTRLDNILHLNTKVNLNLREISELIREKGNLVSKAHAASIGVSGLPHLCVSELALTKRIVTRNADDESISEDDRRRLREFRGAGVLFDARAKWLAKRDVFFDWMITVIQEHERSTESINSRELATFSTLLRHVAEDRLCALVMSKSEDGEYRNSMLDCPSRAYRSQCNDTEEESWLDELKRCQNSEQECLERSKKLLANELKKMLKLIPSSIRV